MKLSTALLAITVAAQAFGAASDPTKTLRLESNESQKTVQLSLHEGDTPLVRCYLYQNSTAWTLDGTETATLAYSTADWDEATNMVTVAGTVGANAYVDFQFAGAQTATNGQFYGEVRISDDSPSRSWVWSELRVEIRKSPIGASGSLTLTGPVNWNTTGPYSGAWPIVAGTNVTIQTTTSNITINADVAGGTLTTNTSSLANYTLTATQDATDAAQDLIVTNHIAQTGTSVHGLGTAATNEASAFATAAHTAVTATTNSLGHIIVGDNLTVDGNGRVSASAAAWGEIADIPAAITNYAVNMDQGVATTSEVTFASVAGDGAGVTNVDATTLDGYTYDEIIGEATRILTYYVWGGSNGPITSTKLASLSSSALESAYTNTAPSVTNGMLIGSYSIANDELPSTLSEGIMHGYANLARTGNVQERTVRAVVRVVESNQTTVVASYTNVSTIVFPQLLSEVAFDIPIAPAIDLDGGLDRLLRLDFYALSGWAGSEDIQSLSQDGYLTRFEFPASPIGVFALDSDLTDHIAQTGTSVHGLGTAATNPASAFATAAEPIATNHIADTLATAHGGELDPSNAVHIADATAAHAGTAISFTPTGTVAATDLQTAVSEVATDAVQAFDTVGEKYIGKSDYKLYVGNDDLHSLDWGESILYWDGVTPSMEWDERALFGTWTIDTAATNGNEIVNYDTAAAMIAAGGGGGGSGAIYYSFPASNESNELGLGPAVVGEINGSGKLIPVFQSDGASNVIERLDPVVHWVTAGTYDLYASAAVHVTNATFTCTNVQLNVYLYDGANQDSTIDYSSVSATDISALTIDTAVTNVISATGTVVIATDGNLGADLLPWSPLGVDGSMHWQLGELTLTPQ